MIGGFCLAEGVDKSAFRALVELAALAGFEVLAVDDEDVGRAIVGGVLGVEDGGECGGERQQKAQPENSLRTRACIDLLRNGCGGRARGVWDTCSRDQGRRGRDEGALGDAWKGLNPVACVDPGDEPQSSLALSSLSMALVKGEAAMGKSALRPACCKRMVGFLWLQHLRSGGNEPWAKKRIWRHWGSLQRRSTKGILICSRRPWLRSVSTTIRHRARFQGRRVIACSFRL